MRRPPGEMLAAQILGHGHCLHGVAPPGPPCPCVVYPALWGQVRSQPTSPEPQHMRNRPTGATPWRTTELGPTACSNKPSSMATLAAPGPGLGQSSPASLLSGPNVGERQICSLPTYPITQDCLLLLLQLREATAPTSLPFCRLYGNE